MAARDIAERVVGCVIRVSLKARRRHRYAYSRMRDSQTLVFAGIAVMQE
jgi:hypothetical protein